LKISKYRLDIYGSSQAAKNGGYAVEAPFLLLLAFEFHVDVAYLAPPAVPHYSCAVVRVAFLGIKYPLLT